MGPLAADMIGGVPQHTSEGDEDADGSGARAMLGERLPEAERAAQEELRRDTAPRRAQNTHADLEHTCVHVRVLVGCRAWLSGESCQGHSEECRHRLENRSAAGWRGQKAREHVARVLENEDKQHEAACMESRDGRDVAEGECASGSSTDLTLAAAPP